MKGAEAERTGAALTIVMATQTNPTRLQTPLCVSPFLRQNPRKAEIGPWSPGCGDHLKQPASILPCAALGPVRKGRAPFRGHLSLGADQGGPIYPAPLSAERDVKCAHSFYIQFGWVTGSREVQTVVTEGASGLLNTYCMRPRGLLSNSRAYLVCLLWARWTPGANPSIGS